MTIEQVTASSIDEAVARPGMTLVDFTAPWCAPCKALNPILDQLNEEWGGRARIVKLNADEFPETAHRFGVMSMPTVIVFKDGVPVDKLVGFRPKQAYEQMLARHMAF